MSCQTFARDLPLAAADCLEPARRAELRAHCRVCPSCAERLQELERVCLAHSSTARELSQLPEFGRLPVLQVTFRKPADTERSIPVRLNWRWALPIGVLAGLALVLFIRQAPVESLRDPESPTPPVKTALVAPAGTTPLPSMAAYHSALRRTADEDLDALLARHERHLLPPTPEPNLAALTPDL